MLINVNWVHVINLKKVIQAKIDLNPIWIRQLGQSQLSNPSDMPCCTQYLSRCKHISFQCGIHVIMTSVNTNQPAVTNFSIKAVSIQMISSFNLLSLNPSEGKKGERYGVLSIHLFIHLAHNSVSAGLIHSKSSSVEPSRSVDVPCHGH